MVRIIAAVLLALHELEKALLISELLTKYIATFIDKRCNIFIQKFTYFDELINNSPQGYEVNGSIVTI